MKENHEGKCMVWLRCPALRAACETYSKEKLRLHAAEKKFDFPSCSCGKLHAWQNKKCKKCSLPTAFWGEKNADGSCDAIYHRDDL